jgi:hypothetical protein
MFHGQAYLCFTQQAGIKNKKARTAAIKDTGGR